jgi:DNA-directed RNA polymerase specialized sigma24 family protein
VVDSGCWRMVGGGRFTARDYPPPTIHTAANKMPADSFSSVMTGEVTVAIPGHEAGLASHRLGALFDAHHQRLYRLARRMSRNADDARDLVQETFLRAARAPGSVPGLESNDLAAEASAQAEEAWLVRVLVNLCKDRWRQAATRQRLDATRALRPAAGPANPESAMIARSSWQGPLLDRSGRSAVETSSSCCERRERYPCRARPEPWR